MIKKSDFLLSNKRLTENAIIDVFETFGYKLTGKKENLTSVTGTAMLPFRICTPSFCGEDEKKNDTTSTELISIDNISAEAEIIICVIDALNAAGLDDFTFRLSHNINQNDADFKELRRLLKKCGYDKYIKLVVPAEKNHEKFEGIVFDVIADDCETVVAKGEKHFLAYDTGKPAVISLTASIMTDVIVLYLEKHDILSNINAADILVFSDCPVLGYKVCDFFRHDGYITEQYIGDDSYENAVSYAKAANIQGVARVCEEENKIIIYNIAEDYSVEEKLSELR